MACMFYECLRCGWTEDCNDLLHVCPDCSNPIKGVWDEGAFDDALECDDHDGCIPEMDPA